jgi:outer membrane biosynthesis protein TonB
VGGMKVKEPSDNPNLDAAAIDGLKAASPFPALPPQFKGKSLGLRFNLSFNATE